jgi:hypothetical protein
MDPINQGSTMPERLMENSIHCGAELRRKTNRELRRQKRAAMAGSCLPAVKRLFALAVAGACLVSGSALQA